MKTPSPVLVALARRYEQRRAGRTGIASRDVLVNLEELLADAGCAEGEARALAEYQLAEAEKQGVVQRVPLDHRDPSYIDKIRLSPQQETAFYAYLGQSSPTQNRKGLADQFSVASQLLVPVRWQTHWTTWCEKQQNAALAGNSIESFNRSPTAENEALLNLLTKLLAWEGESLVRFASCVLCGESKQLERLASLEREGEFAGQLRGKLGSLLEDITTGSVRTLDNLGIVSNPRSVLAHGPLRLHLPSAHLDLTPLRGSYRLSQTDITQALQIETSSPRCLTVENETTFHELAKLQSGTLLICTSYPGSATVALLQRLPLNIEYWHFGDSDQAGFDILRVLREKAARDFQPLHMQSGRLPYEQEALGRPQLAVWPFYTS